MKLSKTFLFSMLAIVLLAACGGIYLAYLKVGADTTATSCSYDSVQASRLLIPADGGYLNATQTQKLNQPEVVPSGVYIRSADRVYYSTGEKYRTKPTPTGAQKVFKVGSYYYLSDGNPNSSASVRFVGVVDRDNLYAYGSYLYKVKAPATPIKFSQNILVKDGKTLGCFSGGGIEMDVARAAQKVLTDSLVVSDFNIRVMKVAADGAKTELDKKNGTYLASPGDTIYIANAEWVKNSPVAGTDPTISFDLGQDAVTMTGKAGYVVVNQTAKRVDIVPRLTYTATGGITETNSVLIQANADATPVAFTIKASGSDGEVLKKVNGIYSVDQGKIFRFDPVWDGTPPTDLSAPTMTISDSSYLISSMSCSAVDDPAVANAACVSWYSFTKVGKVTVAVSYTDSTGKEYKNQVDVQTTIAVSTAQ